MPSNVSRSLALSLLVGALIPGLAGEASAQRSYQKYWAEKYKKTEEPAIIEDDAAGPDLSSERYLYRNDSILSGDTVFPGEGSAAADPVAALALSPYTSGSLSFEVGDASRALKGFEESLKKDPENVWVKLRLAETSMLLNDFSRAQSLIDDVLKVDPDNFRAMSRVAELNLLKREYLVAKEWYKKVLNVKPKNVAALEALAQIAFEIDRDMPQTRKYSDEILLIDGNNIRAMLWSAQAAAVTGDIARAAELYVRLVRYRPGIIDQMAEVARRLAILDRLDDARLLYEKAMLVSPDNDDVRKAWEDIVAKQGGDQAVREAYERIVAESRQDMKIYDLYAEYLKRSADWTRLAEFRDRTLQIDPHNVSALLDMAMIQMREGNFDKAEPYYNRAIEANDADPDVYRAIAQSFIAAQKYDRAAELFKRAIALNPNDITSMGSLSLIQEKAGHPKEAEELLRKALDLAPANPQLLKQLGSFYLRAGDRRKAAELYTSVINTDRLDLPTWLALAQLHFEDENKGALDELERFADDRLADMPEFYSQYGRIAQVFGEYERSRKSLEKGLKVVPGDLGMRLLLSRAYVKLALPDLAIKTLNDADSHIADSDSLKNDKAESLATLYMELNRHQEAQKLWESLIDKSPDDMALREQLVLTLVKQSKDDAVKKELNEVTRRFGVTKPVETQLLRAEIYRAQGDSGRAVSILKQLVQENPNDQDVWFRLALASSEVNDLGLAEQYYRKLIDLGPVEDNQYFETASNNLGYLFAQSGIRLDEAEQLVRKAHEVNPNAAYIMDSLGWVYFKKEDYANARLFLEKAARRSFRDAEVYTNLGQLYEKIGEKDLAREYYDKALDADPNTKVARERRDTMAVKDAPEKPR